MWRGVDVPFVAAAATLTTITPRALARIAGASYSVPCRWTGLDLTAWVGATTVTVVGPDGQRVTHPRKRFGERAIDYRHYLPVLAQKPQAVRQVLPDLLRDLGPPFPTVWQHLLAHHGPRDAARLLAKILGDLETRGAAVVLPALDAAVTRGTSVVLPPMATPRDTLAADAVPLALRDLEVPSGTAADYDAWLQGDAR